MSDFDELYELAADLTDVPSKANRNIQKAIQYTATEVKRDWQQGAADHRLEKYAASVDYDINVSAGAIEAEIGPNLGKTQGPLGIMEDAPGGVKSAPQHAGRDALEANEADFERGLAIAVFDALAEKNL